MRDKDFHPTATEVARARVVEPGRTRFGDCPDCRLFYPVVRTVDEDGKDGPLAGVQPMLVELLLPVGRLIDPEGRPLVQSGVVPDARMLSWHWRWTLGLVPHTHLCPTWWVKRASGPPLLSMRWVRDRGESAGVSPFQPAPPSGS